MMRRILAAVILLSMVLHCASRLGILSYLYKNRNEMAHVVGLISEVPIAMCSGDYDFNEDLNIHHTDTQPGTPISFLTAQEITLFFTPASVIDFNLQVIPHNQFNQPYNAGHYPQPLLNIFQPPKI